MHLFDKMKHGLRRLGAGIGLSLMMIGVSNAGQFDGKFYSFGSSYTDLFGIMPFAENPTRYIDKKNHKILGLVSLYYPISNSLFDALDPKFKNSGDLRTPFKSYGKGGAKVLGATGRGLFTNQVDKAISDLKAKKFAANDIIFLHIGLNDAGVSGKAWFPPLRTIIDNGTVAARVAVQQVEKLVDNGAKNVIFSAFSSYAFVQEHLASQNAIQANVFATAYFTGLQQNLPRLTEKGARIFLLDTNRFFEKIRQDPAKFGFDCYRTCRNWAKDRRAMFDNLHPSTEGFALYAKEIARFYENPQTIPDFGTLILDSGSVNGTYYNEGTLIIQRKKQTALSAVFNGAGKVTLAGPAQINVDASTANTAPAAASSPQPVPAPVTGKGIQVVN
jgi:lysophospholipase L1-like esterase